MRLAYIDGQRFRPEEARVSVYDRGFLYGDSVFETLRTYSGQLFALEEHMARLEESAGKILMDLPVSRDELAEETAAAVAAAGNAESYARVMLSRGTGPVGLDPSNAEKPTRVILVESLTPPPARVYREGLAAICLNTVRASDGADNAKLGNYLASLLALKKAKDEGADEALVVDGDGRVVEGTTFNVFAVRKGRLLTPPDDAGILLGITRREVLAAAEAEGIGVDYAALSPEQLCACDEVFATSSIRELAPIRSIGGTAVAGTTRPEPFAMTHRLHRAFRARVGAEAPSYGT